MEKSEIKPLVSIITVCYNAGAEIERTIKSVLSQKYENLEYIVIDGGSKDNTKDVIQHYQDRIDIFISEPDNGIYDAMNKGTKLSHGKWLNFMNAGDVFNDDNVLDEIINNGPFDNNIKIIYGNVLILYEGQKGIIKKPGYLCSDKIQFDLNHQSTLIEGDWMRQEGYDTSYKIAADAHFFNETAKCGFLFQYVPVTIAKYEASVGVSAVNQMRLFNEIMRIKNIKKGNLQWVKGYLRACFFNFMHHIPYGIGEKMLALYIRKRVRG